MLRWGRLACAHKSLLIMDLQTFIQVRVLTRGYLNDGAFLHFKLHCKQCASVDLIRNWHGMVSWLQLAGCIGRALA